MPQISDYAIIADTKFSIEIGGDIDKEFNFTLQSGASPGSRSILEFMIAVESSSPPLELEVKINGSSQLKHIGSRSYSTFHEVINANVLQPGSNNIEFRITTSPGRTGRVEIGDVVLHYQRNI